MRRWISSGMRGFSAGACVLAVTALVLLAAGCGSGEEAAPPVEPAPAQPPAEPPAEPPAPPDQVTITTPPATTAPEEPPAETGPALFSGVLEEGKTYGTTVFQPAYTLTAPSDQWLVPYPELRDANDITDPSRSVYGISFYSGQNVISSKIVPDPQALPESNPTEKNKTVGEWVKWFSNHPQLKAGKVTATSVGGFDAKVLDVAVPGGYPVNGCQTKCVFLFGPQSDGRGVTGAEKGDYLRVHVIDVNGTPTVVLQWGGSEKEFKDNLPEMDAMLETIDFQ
jgi:hypothetical protein